MIVIMNSGDFFNTLVNIVIIYGGKVISMSLIKWDVQNVYVRVKTNVGCKFTG